jgi:hypothetical protein
MTKNFSLFYVYYMHWISNHDGKMEMVDQIFPDYFLLATMVSFNISHN